MDEKEIVPKEISDLMKYHAFLNELLAVTKEILDSLQEKKIDFEYQRVLYRFIQRFDLNFTTIKNIWENFLNNSKFRHPIYLLLRSLISDCFLMLYLSESLKWYPETKEPVETDFKKRYVEISNSYFQRVEKEIERQIKNNIITKEEREEFLKNEKEFYPEHFENGNRLKIKKISNTDIGTLIQKLEQEESKNFIPLYQCYFYFSQYEHFTVKTDDLLAVCNNDMSLIFVATYYLVRGLLNNIELMKLDKSLQAKVIELTNNLRKMVDEKES